MEDEQVDQVNGFPTMQAKAMPRRFLPVYPVRRPSEQPDLVWNTEKKCSLKKKRESSRKAQVNPSQKLIQGEVKAKELGAVSHQ